MLAERICFLNFIFSTFLGSQLSDNYLNVLMLGDLVGTPGMEEIYLKLSKKKNKERINLVIANGENSDDGFGITESIIKKFKECGVDVITSGNHIWSNNDADKLLDTYNYLLRPANYPYAVGKGWWTGEVNNITVGVVNLLGRYNMIPIDCPFQVLNKLLKNELKKCSIVVVDFHAESSAEKRCLAFAFDGIISLLAGTHTHVQTADEMILPKGTGYITDLGICGGIDSVIGMERENILKRIINQTIVPYIPAKENTKLQGIVAKIDINLRKTVEIKRFSI